MQQLVDIVQSKRLGTKSAAGQSTVTGAVQAKAGEGFRLTVGMGTIVSGGVQSVKIQQGNLADGSDMADLAGTKIDIPDTASNKCVQSDVYRLSKAYWRYVISRATQNSEVDFVLVDIYGQRLLPTELDSTVVAKEKFASPAEGTA